MSKNQDEKYRTCSLKISKKLKHICNKKNIWRQLFPVSFILS